LGHDLRRALRVLTLLFTIGLIAGWFALLRPGTLGGTTGYIVVTGSSMQPTLNPGDLAIVRSQSNYTAGDIIAFRVEQGVVIHRIVAGNALKGFVTKGDNKKYADVWLPTPTSVIGKMWFDLPTLGIVLVWLRQPFHLALASAAVAFLVVLSWPKRRPSVMTRAPQ